MRKYKKAIVVFLTTLILSTLVAGCNPVARRMGGNMTINLKPGEKLVNATWKDSSLWILTRKMRPDDVEETYKFKEDSTFGVLEGTVTIYEYKEGK